MPKHIVLDASRVSNITTSAYESLHDIIKSSYLKPLANNGEQGIL